VKEKERTGPREENMTLPPTFCAIDCIITVMVVLVNVIAKL
jgi:hypothetical protein